MDENPNNIFVHTSKKLKLIKRDTIIKTTIL